jgi:hypothetical protein
LAEHGAPALGSKREEPAASGEAAEPDFIATSSILLLPNSLPAIRVFEFCRRALR